MNMKMMVAAAVIALALAVLLVWRSPAITPRVYQFGFFLGLGTLAAILVSSRLRFIGGSSSGGGEMMIRLGTSTFAKTAVVPFFLMAMTPYIILMEVGITGYRGFSSFVRYVSLGVAFLGAIALLAGLLIPWFLRRGP